MSSWESYQVHGDDLGELVRVQAEPTPGLLTLHTHAALRPEVGQLETHDYLLPGGLLLSEISGHLHRPLTFVQDVAEPWVGLLYQFRGHADSWMDGTRQSLVPTGQHNLLWEDAQRLTHTLYPDAQGQYRAFHLKLGVGLFADLVENNAEWLTLYRARLPRQEPFLLLREAAAVAPPVTQLIGQILQCPYAGVLKRVFLEARFMDMFVEQQSYFLRHVAEPRPRRSDRDLFHAIRHHLDAHYAAPPSLLELARLFGLNDFKLKRGFKAEFGTTVFGYVANKRLSEARALLETTARPVQEIGEDVGFANPAHFATAFRKKFGVAPSQVRRDPALLKAAGQAAQSIAKETSPSS
ncbi:AraC family transcriptional regulator [Hymenobacter sp. 15J16-1T3B]|uniref:helix-turn-helix transcriptional regulator n=1 Tax=Hymenobacter sp. 15J16-1T3B TaxID=2886941 RepID=UPI001D126902|nr:AraC family transcriptional regulator [Hymenobacter sp. 15J16-1T3B]MCC3156196.1 AraC family transcriptional regulator [Hymenobacter sp. 15J16-1T3B]